MSASNRRRWTIAAAGRASEKLSLCGGSASHRSRTMYGSFRDEAGKVHVKGEGLTGQAWSSFSAGYSSLVEWSGLGEDLYAMASPNPGQSREGRTSYRRLTSRSVELPKERWYKRIRIPGVTHRASPHSNVVHTTKYTIITFVPKNLWEQFHRLANLYFLMLMILTFVPAVEAVAKEVAWIPLTFILIVTAIKDLFEDFRRYRSDREVNRRQCRVYDW